MIAADILKYLGKLEKNNNREWFHENKKEYQDLRENFINLVDIIINEINVFDKGIAGISSRSSIFRINRDIRFSKDKSPYKTNFGAFILEGGKKSGNAGYYLHIESGKSMIAGGIYMPPAPQLKAVRSEIYDNAMDFKDILSNDNFKNTFPEGIWGEKLKLAPKGFPKDFEDIELLKYKSYTVAKNMSDKEICSESLLNVIIDTFKAMAPFNKFINHAIKTAK